MFLKQFKKYRHDNLTVWPYHCLEGSWGWCFPEELVEALNEWGFNHNKTYEIFEYYLFNCLLYFIICWCRIIRFIIATIIN